MDDSFDDTRLAQVLRTGDPAGLRVGFERHGDAMNWLARSLTGRDEADTGSLVEELWTSAAADYAQAQPGGSARVWLFGRLIDEPGVAPEAPDFLPAEDPWKGHWREFPVPWHLMLMVFGGTELLPSTRQVDGQRVESFLTEYLESCEGQVRRDDEEAQRLLAAGRRPGGLPLLLIEELSGEEPPGEPS